MATQLLFGGKRAAELLDMSDRSLRQLSAEGAIPFIQVGRYRKYSPDDLARWISENKTTGESASQTGSAA